MDKTYLCASMMPVQRLTKGIGQTELVRLLQLDGIAMTRETLVKIERGIQHIQAAQLRGIRDALRTTYNELRNRTTKQITSLLQRQGGN